jgi:hypothetical protein
MAYVPVVKFKKKTFRSNIIINDGLHFHALLLIPPVSRLACSFQEHFLKHEAMYLNKCRIVARLDVEPIVTESSERLIYYFFKALKRGLSYDDILILPKVRSELEDKPRSTPVVCPVSALTWRIATHPQPDVAENS